MWISRISVWSGKQHTEYIPVTPAQLQMWRDGTVIQVAMPHLLPWQREFLITGMTESEWKEMSQEDM